MFQSLRSGLKNKDVRTKLLFVLLLVFVYRLGSFIPIPGVNLTAWQTATSNLTALSDLMNLLSGSSFSRFTIFAMGVSPYITASIVLQLLCVVFDKLDKFKKDNDKKYELVTKVVGIVFSAIQAICIVIGYNATIKGSIGEPIVAGTGFAYVARLAIIGLCSAAGTFGLIKLSDVITEKGLGNGISILIFTSIIASMTQMITSGVSSMIAYPTVVGGIRIAMITIIALAMIVATVFVDRSARNVPVTYSGSHRMRANNTLIPMNVNANGVLPLIFAVTILQLPEIIIQFCKAGTPFANFYYRWLASSPKVWNGMMYESTGVTALSGAYNIGIQYAPFIYYIVYTALIIAFGYYYTSITFNAREWSDSIRRNGGFLPGIRPGRPTEDYLNNISKRLTLFGSLFMAAIAILPTILFNLLGVSNVFGATSVLIIVSVSLELIRAYDCEMRVRNYKKLMN